MRAGAALNTKPASTRKEYCRRAVAITHCTYLALYRLVLTEPSWRGVREPGWCLSQRITHEVRLYGHHAAREHQVLFAVENGRRGEGGQKAWEAFTHHRDVLQQLARAQARLDEPLPASLAPTEPAALTVANLLRRAAGNTPNDSELGAAVREFAHGMQLDVKAALVAEHSEVCATRYPMAPGKGLGPCDCERRAPLESKPDAADRARLQQLAAELADAPEVSTAELAAEFADVQATAEPQGHTDNCEFWNGEAGRAVGSGTRCTCGLEEASKRVDAALAVHHLLKTEGGSR